MTNWISRDYKLLRQRWATPTRSFGIHPDFPRASVALKVIDSFHGESMTTGDIARVWVYLTTLEKEGLL